MIRALRCIAASAQRTELAKALTELRPRSLFDGEAVARRRWREAVVREQCGERLDLGLPTLSPDHQFPTDLCASSTVVCQDASICETRASTGSFHCSTERTTGLISIPSLVCARSAAS